MVIRPGHEAEQDQLQEQSSAHDLPSQLIHGKGYAQILERDGLFEAIPTKDDEPGNYRVEGKPSQAPPVHPVGETGIGVKHHLVAFGELQGSR